MDAPFPEGMLECIEKFFSEEKSRKPGHTIYRDVFDTNLMFPLQRMRELSKMMKLAQSVSPITVMEIGADKGGGLYHWCKCLPTVKNVIACEIRGTPYKYLFEKNFPHINFKWIEGSSYDINNRDSVAHWLGKNTPIDCLFIDGDKSSFLTDFIMYKPLINPKGIVFMHDIRDEGPAEAWRTVQQWIPKCEEIIDTSEFEELNQLINNFKPRTLKLIPYAEWLKHWEGRSCGVGVIYLESVSKEYLEEYKDD